MKKRVRVCGKVCHSAKGKRCSCFCGGFYHGKDGAGADNRASLAKSTEDEQIALLQAHGFNKGETVYIEQTHLPISEGTERERNMQSADIKTTVKCPVCGAEIDHLFVADYSRKNLIDGKWINDETTGSCEVTCPDCSTDLDHEDLVKMGVFPS